MSSGRRHSSLRTLASDVAFRELRRALAVLVAGSMVEALVEAAKRVLGSCAAVGDEVKSISNAVFSFLTPLATAGAAASGNQSQSRF